MSRTQLIISNAFPRSGVIIQKLPFCEIIGQDVVMNCSFDSSWSLNEGLVWMWGHLNFHRRYIKGLQADGAVICVRHKPDGQPIEILPNGAEMLHLLGISLVIERPVKGDRPTGQ